MSDFKHVVENGMMITGGHFCLTENHSSINAGTIASFRSAVALYSSEKSRCSSLGIGLLINDIGQVCSSSACEMRPVTTREHFSFPEVYLAILDEFEIHKEEVVIFWEKHIRNRAKKQLHTQLAKKNPYIIYLEQEGYVYRPQNGGDIVLTRYHQHDRKGAPACPLIMSAYSLEHKRMGYPSSLNFYYVGKDNYMNVSNHFVIEKGYFLAACFDNALGVIRNVYQFEDRTMKNFL